MKEAQFCGHIVKNAREKYQKNTYEHGLIMVKLSNIEELLQNSNIALELKNVAKQVMKNCIGIKKTDLLLKHKSFISLKRVES